MNGHDYNPRELSRVLLETDIPNIEYRKVDKLMAKTATEDLWKNPIFCNWVCSLLNQHRNDHELLVGIALEPLEYSLKTRLLKAMMQDSVKYLAPEEDDE